LLITVILAVVLYTAVGMIVGGPPHVLWLVLSHVIAGFLFDYTIIEELYIYIFESDYWIFILSAIILAMLHIVVMVAGFLHGYEKRGKERAEIMSNKRDIS